MADTSGTTNGSGAEAGSGDHAAGDQVAGDHSEVNTPDRAAVLGHAMWLMAQSAAHRHLFIVDLEWALIPPVALGQFRLWRRQNMPIGFASWGFLTPEADARVAGGNPRLQPQEWNAGQIAWIMDVITPMGGSEQAIQELRQQVFSGRKVKTIQPAPGGGMSVVELTPL